MKQIYLAPILLLASMLVLTACSDDSDPYMTVSTNSVFFDAKGNGNGSVSIRVDYTGWNAAITEGSQYFSVNPQSGNDSQTIYISTSSENKTTERRLGKIRVTSTKGNFTEEITITQEAGEPTLSVDESELEFSAGGETLSFNISSNTEWEISNTPEWLSVSPSTGSGDKRINVKSSENPSISNRTGKLRIRATKNSSLYSEIAIKQLGTNVVLNVDNKSINFEAEGGSQTISVTSNSGWNISGNPGWLYAEPSYSYAPSSGTETKIVTIRANENTTSNDRDCVLNITTSDGKYSTAVAIKQERKKEILSISGLDAPFIYEAGSQMTAQELYITCNSSWSISGKPDWLDITPISGEGNATVKVWPNSENTSSQQREAIITVRSGTLSATKNVIQRGSNISTCYSRPDVVIPLTESIAWNYEFSSDMHHVYFTLMPELESNAMTDTDVLKYVVEKADNDNLWLRRTPEQFREWGNAFSFYGVESNTNYVILSVAYDNNNRVGEINRTRIHTPEDNPYICPWTQTVGFSREDNNGQTFYRIFVEKDATNGAYSDKFYSWAIVATNVDIDNFQTWNATRAQLALWMFLEIRKNPSPHDTYINGNDRSYYREHLDGPVAEASYTLPCNLFDDRYLQIVTWCLLSDGGYSGRIFNGAVDFWENNVKDKMQMKISEKKETLTPRIQQFNPNEFGNNARLIRLK